MTSEASGGSCGSGALSAAFSKAMMPVTGPMVKSSPFAGLAISSIVGGTASVLGGGKFSNGATTAAFGYLYNALGAVARRNIIIGSTVLGGSAAVIGCTTVTGGACAGGAVPVFAGGARLGFRFGVFAANLADSLGIFSSTESGEEASITSDDEKKQDVEKDPRRRFNKGERDRAQDRSKDPDGDPSCEYCGTKTTNKPGQPNSAQTDHIDAWSKGGRSNDSNAANSCRSCNLSKGAKDLGTQWLPPGYR